MTALSKNLAESLERLPGCIFAGYVDLSVGMVLGSAAQVEIPEDIRDNLAVAALNYLGGAKIRALAEGLGGAPDSFDEALVAADGATHVFMRLVDHPDHVLCFVFPDEGDPRPLLETARNEAANFPAPDFLE